MALWQNERQCTSLARNVRNVRRTLVAVVARCEIERTENCPESPFSTLWRPMSRE